MDNNQNHSLSKADFMYRLYSGLSKLKDSDRVDIMNDYEEHFRAGAENGKSESEITAELGNVDEIINSFLEEYNIPPAQQSTYNNYQPQPTYTQTVVVEDKTSKRILVILGLVFLGIPFASIILSVAFSLVGMTIGFSICGSALIGSAFMVTGASLFALVFLGISLIALSVLCVCGEIGLIKGTILLTKKIVAYCKRIFS